MHTNLHNLIRIARVEKGLTQQQLADLVKLDRGVIAGYETQVHIPSLRHFVKIAKVLDIDIKQIEFWDVLYDV